MFECTTNDYAEIYAPWIARGVDLLDLSGWTPDNRLLDICGGTGVIAKEAIRRGATKPVHMLDLNPRCNVDGVVATKGDANRVDEWLWRGLFDVVVCRQAMAYLDPDMFFRSVSQVMKPGGVLVFNIFCDPETVGWKTTNFEGKVYREAHLAIFGQVVHVQALMGWPPKVDISTFRNHDFAHLWSQMSHYFDATVEFKGHSAKIRAVKLDEYRA